MEAYVEAALLRLNSQLPLFATQQKLPRELAALHRATLRSLFEKGRPLTRDEAAAVLHSTGVEEAFNLLAANDLVVRSKTANEIAGAYPMTTEPTPHQLVLEGRTVNAMCALDALSVTPMFGGTVEIRSKCRITKEPVAIRQNGTAIEHAAPATVLVGVRWATPCGHAAHSMCMEMVFLKDADAAEKWHGGDLVNHTMFPLADAVAFGAAFFCPLVADERTSAAARS